MDFERVLITGGAGFVGANLAVLLREACPQTSVIALDNLKRRGSELNLPRLRAAGVDFLHGDIRCVQDLEAARTFDLLIDCSAEASVQAGQHGSPRDVLETNLMGTINCLEAARTNDAAFLFLSTSRVFPIESLNRRPFEEQATRFVWCDPEIPQVGFSAEGVAEDYPLHGARSFYGTSKLACEQLIQEYVYTYGLRALINRCGLLAGPWQMGRSDQGVISLWVARHHFKQSLKYIGFGGEGRQVRDVLHIHDLFDLVHRQLKSPDQWDGRGYNVGGGRDVSVSLQELTELCASVTGHRIPIESVPETSAVDLRIYLTDTRRAQQDFGWKPVRGPRQIVQDIRDWIADHEEVVCRVLA